MAFEDSNFEATLAAAAGDDFQLAQELYEAFLEGFARQLDLLKRARCDANWLVSAEKLRGLAASFHAEALQRLAEEALTGAPGEPGVIRRLDALYRDVAGRQRGA